MNAVAAVLRRALVDLAEQGVGVALVGGLAVSTRAEPRFTRDTDLAVAVEGDAHAERVLFGLRGRGYRPMSAFEHLDTGRLSTVRLVPPGSGEDGVLVDLLFASSGIEAEIVRDAEAMDVFTGVGAPVARVGHLVALKLLSADPVRRPQDLVDLRGLVPFLDATELARCREAIAAVHARGYHRGRDLAAALAALVP
jgi:hypothetical protein